mmetsp:Transcript_102830/g.289188  ORF Transcript_102830/g.289188 Transcript_102830/m.289188 type:complete len:218 (+) Transcript_102830:1053-1706(+)
MRSRVVSIPLPRNALLVVFGLRHHQEVLVLGFLEHDVWLLGDSLSARDLGDPGKLVLLVLVLAFGPHEHVAPSAMLVRTACRDLGVPCDELLLASELNASVDLAVGGEATGGVAPIVDPSAHRAAQAELAPDVHLAQRTRLRHEVVDAAALGRRHVLDGAPEVVQRAGTQAVLHAVGTNTVQHLEGIDLYGTRVSTQTHQGVVEANIELGPVNSRLQ